MKEILFGVLGLGLLWQLVINIIQFFIKKQVTDLDKKIEIGQNKVIEAEKTADQLIREYEDAKKKYDSDGGNA